MLPIYHRYSPPWLLRFYTVLFDILGCLLPPYLFFSPLLRAVSGQRPLGLSEIVVLLFVAVLVGLICLVAANYFVEIQSDDAGLHVRFFWRSLLVPWSDVVALRPSVFNLPFTQTMWVIQTRALTPFHRLYGLLYSFSPAPSLRLAQTISDYDELVRRIRAHLQVAG